MLRTGGLKPFRQLSTSHKSFVLNYICLNTRVYYIDDYYYDDVGETPYTNYSYFGAECRPIRWVDRQVIDGVVTDIIYVNYYLGVGGKVFYGYKF